MLRRPGVGWVIPAHTAVVALEVGLPVLDDSRDVTGGERAANSQGGNPDGRSRYRGGQDNQHGPTRGPHGLNYVPEEKLSGRGVLVKPQPLFDEPGRVHVAQRVRGRISVGVTREGHPGPGGEGVRGQEAGQVGGVGSGPQVNQSEGRVCSAPVKPKRLPVARRAPGSRSPPRGTP